MWGFLCLYLRKMSLLTPKEADVLQNLENSVKTISDTFEQLDRNSEHLDIIYNTTLHLQGLQSLAITKYVEAYSLRAVIWVRVLEKMENDGSLKKLGVTLVKLKIEGDPDYNHIAGLEMLLENYVSMIKDSNQTFRTILATKRAEMENGFSLKNTRS